MLRTKNILRYHMTKCKNLDDSMEKITTNIDRLSTKEKNSSKNVQISIAKGTRDLCPHLSNLRNKLFKIITTTFKQHGAEELDTPVFELKETLTNKYGDDSKLIYDLADQGGQLLSLRYDLTVPLARYVGMNKLDRIKRFHIAKVYRRDNPAMNRGRFREFYQCDFDICGDYQTILPDVECVHVVCGILSQLSLGSFIAKINHRSVLDGYMQICGVPDNLMRTISSSIDKLDKTSWQDVKKEMITEKGLDEAIANHIGTFVTQSGGVELIHKLMQTYSSTNSTFSLGLQELLLFFKYANSLNIDQHLLFDLSLARGLDYYTGTIFELVMTNTTGDINVGSVAGGGRYDNLIGMFSKSNRKIPAVGISIGVERLLSLLENQMKENKIKIKTTDIMVFVSSLSSEFIPQRLSIANQLWQASIPTEIQYKNKGKVLRDYQYCEEHSIPFCIIIGEDEVKGDYVSLRQISTRNDHKITRVDLIPRIKEYISKFTC